MSQYVYNKHNTTWKVLCTVFTHSLFLYQRSYSFAALTRRFLIHQQLVRKYRTPVLSMKYSLFFFRSNVFMDILTFDVQSYASFKSTKYNMRNSEAELSKRRFRTDVLKFSFFNRIVNLWNDLPVAIFFFRFLILLC